VDDPLIPNAIRGDGTDIGAFELNTQTCNHPPVAQCKSIQVSADNNCEATITAAQVDNGSFDPDPGDSIATRTLDDSGPFGLGPHTVMLTVTDTRGAFSSCSATVTVVDTTPPQVICPANIVTRTANPGDPIVVVSYAPASATDNCSTPTAVCSPPSGSQFPRGTTTVICIATDAASNPGSCSFTVTVFDVCVQDDTTGDTLLFDSQTGDYLFVRCGTSGFRLSGKATVQVKDGIIVLIHNAADRRVLARIVNSQKKGNATVQTFSPVAIYTLTDRNTLDNTCACP
jgi:HYR domain